MGAATYISERVIYLSAKEQLANILDFIGENEASRILSFVKETFLLKPKAWEDIEEDDPSPDEIAAFKEYRANT